MNIILTEISLGLLGVLSYSLWKAKDYIFNKNFVFSKILNENWKVWLWSFLLIMTLSISINIEPNIKNIIKNIFAIDLDSSGNSFFFFGATINILIKRNKNSQRNS